MDHGVERHERHAHVRGVNRDAPLAGPEDRVHARIPLERRASSARIAPVAPAGEVAKVRAARPLQEIAAEGGHVAELRRSARQQRLREGGPALHHAGMMRQRGVGDPCPHAKTVRVIFDAVERQSPQLHQPAGRGDLEAHEIHHGGPARGCSIHTAGHPPRRRPPASGAAHRRGRPSMVVIFAPFAVTARVRHARTRCPSMRTVQAPHCP